ncbi:THREONINE--TRNA LIGASE CYTOPLASMIC [Salix viminalis]|uniref:THREONINE--TRNA LIGASE CYTOPLASMIC n=1 Tax=Salix viminalis TaxID=40686 RepID=A0A9Q0Z4R2_SALVM|nr:THREONINE--TRNA LIGASE CYTOPLASMIC [Salix viminalis]
MISGNASPSSYLNVSNMGFNHGLLFQGFYYDAYYGELGLNDNHLKQIDAAVLKVVAVLFHSLVLEFAILGVIIVVLQCWLSSIGALTGLTRVRRFQQDDAHIFCRKSQIKAEVRGVLEFIDYAYEKFGFTYDLKLSAFNEGDGAFYGPKIDISISDALKEISVCHIAARLPASRSY